MLSSVPGPLYTAVTYKAHELSGCQVSPAESCRDQLGGCCPRTPCTCGGLQPVGLGSRGSRGSLSSRHRPVSLIAIKTTNKQYNSDFCLSLSFLAKLGPVTLCNGSSSEKLYSMNLKSAPETNYDAISWPFLGQGQENLK